MTPLALHLTKFDAHYFWKESFSKQFKTPEGFLDTEKLNNYLEDCFSDDFVKIQSLLINPIDIKAVIKYIQYLLKVVDEIIAKSHYVVEEMLTPQVNRDMEITSENSRLGLKGFENNYQKRDAYMYRDIMLTVSHKATRLKHDIQKLLAHYESTTKEEVNVTVSLNDMHQVTEETAITNEPEFILPHPDAFIAIMRVFKERNLIQTNDRRKTAPSNNKLAKFIFSNFKLPANNETGYLKAGSIETYLSSKNENEAFQKVYDKLYEATKSVV